MNRYSSAHVQKLRLKTFWPAIGTIITGSRCPKRSTTMSLPTFKATPLAMFISFHPKALMSLKWLVELVVWRGGMKNVLLLIARTSAKKSVTDLRDLMYQVKLQIMSLARLRSAINHLHGMIVWILIMSLIKPQVLILTHLALRPYSLSWWTQPMIALSLTALMSTRLVACWCHGMSDKKAN